MLGHSSVVVSQNTSSPLGTIPRFLCIQTGRDSKPEDPFVKLRRDGDDDESRIQRATLQALAKAARGPMGPGLLLGGTGTGKSPALACRMRLLLERSVAPAPALA